MTLGSGASSLADVEPLFRASTALAIPCVERADVSEAIGWRASDGAPYITGVIVRANAGTTLL
jgi:hypothetical protein